MGVASERKKRLGNLPPKGQSGVGITEWPERVRWMRQKNTLNLRIR